MTDSYYDKVKYSGSIYVETLRAGQRSYHRILTEEIYPKIYKGKKWMEYCLLNENSERYYAQKDGLEFYPRDSDGALYVLSGPKFISHLDITFAHLHTVIWPLLRITKEFDQYRVFKTKPDLSVGGLYLQVMTSTGGLNLWNTTEEERFSKGDKTFKGSRAFVQADGHLFIFKGVKRHYVNFDCDSFIDLNTCTPYELDGHNNVLYFKIDPLGERQYFVNENCIVFCTNKDAIYVHEARDGKTEIYASHLPKSLGHVSTIHESILGQEFDGKGNLVSFVPNKFYHLWYEKDQIVRFELNGKTKKRFEFSASGERNYFHFKGNSKKYWMKTLDECLNVCLKAEITEPKSLEEPEPKSPIEPEPKPPKEISNERYNPCNLLFKPNLSFCILSILIAVFVYVIFCF